MSHPLYLFLFAVLFFLVAFVLRSYLLWKNTGINPMTFSGSDDANGFNGKLFKVVAVLEFLILGIYAFAGSWYEYLLPFWYLENVWVQIFGWILLVSSLIWVFTAQLQMANSWRIGIDYNNKTPLITKGLFTISRNPIFLGILITNLGLFLVIPNAFTLLIAGLSFTSIHTQVRLEEAFLRELHGTTYEAYCQKVNRWI